MDEKQRAIIEVQWARVAPRLLMHIKRKIGCGLLPKGLDAEDVVSIAFERLLAGSRSWDHEKVDLETHMKQSILRSLLGSKGLPSVKNADAGEFTDEEDLNHLNNEGVRSCDTLRDSIPEMDKITAFTMLEQEVQGDKELSDVLAAIRMGCAKPAHIAEMTGFDVKRIYWLQQKLDGYANKVRLKLSDRCVKGEQ